MKKRIMTLFCLLALFAGQKSFANDYCEPYYEPCSNWCSDLSYAVSADYLYWAVTRPEAAFLLELGTVNFLQPQYHSGYRIAAALYYNCVDFEARYTSFNDRAFIPPGAIDPTTPTFGINYDPTFQVVDLAFGYTRYFQCHRGYLKPYVGAKLAWIQESIHVFDDEDSVLALDTNAYGPMLGIEGSWELFRCWIPVSLVARGDLSVLRAATKFAQPGIVFLNRNFGLVSVQDLYLGLGFDFCNFSCFDVNLQVGYEAQIWDSMRTLGANFPGTFGLNGLVVHLGVMF